MSKAENNSDQVHYYVIFKRFHHHVPCPANYFVKIVGVDNVEEDKKRKNKKLQACKRGGPRIKVSVYRHLLRNIKRKLNLINKPYHEITKSL